MTLFLSAVLAAAAFQSFCKLALLPRRWELLAAALLLPLPFLFEQRLAQTSLAAVTASLWPMTRLCSVSSRCSRR